MLQKEIKEMAAVAVVHPKKAPDEQKKLCWNINREMLPYKLHFFLFIGGMGAVLPYVTVYAKNNLALSATSLATIYTTQQFIFIFSKPAIGYLADYFNKLKPIIVSLSVIQGIALFCLLAIPNIDIEDVSKINHTETDFSQHVCNVCYEHNLEINSTDICSDLKQSGCDKSLHQFADKNFNVFCFSTTDNEAYDYAVLNTSCSVEFVQNTNQDPEQLASKNVSFHIIVFHLSSKCTKINEFHMNQNESSEIGCYNLSIKSLMERRQSNYFFCNASKDISTGTTVASVTSEISMFQSYQFWLFAVISTISSICCNSLFTMADTACYESLQNTGSDYGKQRLWGAVSWGIIAPFAGFLNDYTNSYLAAWCLMAGFCLLEIWNISRVNLVKPHFSQNILKDIRTVMSSKEFVAFAFGVFMNGIATGIIWFYLAWFLSSIGGSRLLIGLAHCVQCFFGELPFMFYSGGIIKKFGHFNVVTLAIFSHCIRFFWYSYFRNPWLMLPIESIHGFTYGTFYAAMTSYAKLNAKPGIEASTQSVLCTMYEGFGAGLGCVLSGIGFDTYGGHGTFFYASICCGVATAINIIASLLLRKQVKTVEFMKSAS